MNRGLRFVNAIRRLAPRADRAAIGTVVAFRGNCIYRVNAGGVDYDVPAAGDATARDGQHVAVLISGQTGRPIAMLGVVTKGGL